MAAKENAAPRADEGGGKNQLLAKLNYTAPRLESGRRAPPPAFLVYAANLLVDRQFKLMALDERGLDLTMKCECWVNGSVPAERQALARVLGLDAPEVSKALTERVLRDFEQQGDVLICPALVEYREHLDKRHAAQSKAGTEKIREINERRRKSRLADESPDGLADGSLIQPKPTQPKPTPSLESGDIPTEHSEWLSDYDGPALHEPDGRRGRVKPGMRG